MGYVAEISERHTARKGIRFMEKICTKQKRDTAIVKSAAETSVVNGQGYVTDTTKDIGEHMLEKDVVDKLRIALKVAGIVYVRRNHGSMYSAGRPDLEILHLGHFTAVEAKRSEKELQCNVTPLQWKEIEAIQAAGGDAYAATIRGGRGKYDVLIRASQKVIVPVELDLVAWAMTIARAPGQLRVIDYIRRGQSNEQ